MKPAPRWTIYCHQHRESGRLYVGLTRLTMLKRWNRHVYSAMAVTKQNGRTHFANAIRKYGREAFSHEILEVCSDLEVANLAEECWIELLDTRNPEKGFNLMKGGEHVPHPVKNPWYRPEYREKNRLRMKSLWEDPEFREKNLLRMKNLWKDPKFRAARVADLARLNASITPEERSARTSELWSDSSFRDKVAAGCKAAFSDPAVLEKASVAQRGKKLSSEHVEKSAAAHRGKKLSPEHCATISSRMKGRVFSPEQLANMSLSQRGRVLSTETRAKIGAKAMEAAARRKELGQKTVLSDEARSKISAAARASNARRKSLGFRPAHGHEARSKIAAAVVAHHARRQVVLRVLNA